MAHVLALFSRSTLFPPFAKELRCILYLPRHLDRPTTCLLVDPCLFVEVEATDDVHPINKAQLLSYMKLLDISLGLIINFNELKLTDGVSRLIISGANLE
jgi:GxxExxY protein